MSSGEKTSARRFQDGLDAQNIKALSACHTSALSGLHTSCFARGWSEAEFSDLFQKRGAWGMGLWLEDALISFALFAPTGDDAELLSIATLEPHRGHGFAAQLLGHGIGESEIRGHERLLLEVAEDNKPALRLYKNLGFKEDGRRQNYYRSENGPPKDAILMSLKINTSL